MLPRIRLGKSYDSIGAELLIVATTCLLQKASDALTVQANSAGRMPNPAPQLRDLFQIAGLLCCTRCVHNVCTSRGQCADANDRTQPDDRRSTLRPLNIRTLTFRITLASALQALGVQVRACFMMPYMLMSSIDQDGPVYSAVPRWWRTARAESTWWRCRHAALGH